MKHFTILFLVVVSCSNFFSQDVKIKTPYCISNSFYKGVQNTFMVTYPGEKTKNITIKSSDGEMISKVGDSLFTITPNNGGPDTLTLTLKTKSKPKAITVRVPLKNLVSNISVVAGGKILPNDMNINELSTVGALIIRTGDYTEEKVFTIMSFELFAGGKNLKAESASFTPEMKSIISKQTSGNLVFEKITVKDKYGVVSRLPDVIIKVKN
jgi:hypothetical protein